jgi:hypothetical protein
LSPARDRLSDDLNTRDLALIELSTAQQTCRMRTPVASTLPIVDQAVDVTALRIREREPRHDPRCLCWIAVLDCSLEPLADWFGLL